MTRLYFSLLLLWASSSSSFLASSLVEITREWTSPSLAAPLDSVSWDQVVLASLVKVATVLGLVHTFLPSGLPGSANRGAWWPPIVIEQDIDRISSLPLDPYSISHVNHGVLGALATWLVGGSLEVGLTATVLSAELFEMVENTRPMIDRFRESGGPNKFYEGDSKINSAMDVVVCGLGFAGAVIVGPWVALASILVSEEIVILSIIIVIVINVIYHHHHHHHHHHVMLGLVWRDNLLLNTFDMFGVDHNSWAAAVDRVYPGTAPFMHIMFPTEDQVWDNKIENSTENVPRYFVNSNSNMLHSLWLKTALEPIVLI